MIENFQRIPQTYNGTGLDGSGKSTQTSLLAEALRNQGHDVVTTKAYHDEHKQRYGSIISTLATSGEIGNIMLTMMFKVFERQQLNVTLNAVKNGSVVLTDRWDEGFEAYHRQKGFASQYPKIRSVISGLGFGGYIPKQTFFYDLPYEVAQERMGVRGTPDAFDARGREYHDMMRTGFHQLAAERNWEIVDGRLPIDEIHLLVAQAVLADL